MKSFLNDLKGYALGQVAHNLPAILTAGGVIVGGVIDKTKLPGGVKTLVKGTLAAGLGVLAHNGGSPADPAASAVQAVLHRAGAR
jgi:hypothetical protein